MKTAVVARVAMLFLVGTVLALSALAVYGTYRTRAAAASAEVSTALSDRYQQAAAAIAAQESIEREYRLVPSPQLRAKLDSEQARLHSSLADVRAIGSDADREQATRVLNEHVTYRGALDHMFAYVDSGDPATVQRIDNEVADPAFNSIEQQVNAAAQSNRQTAQQSVESLRLTEQVVFAVTVVSFTFGLILILIAGRVFLRYQRQLLRQSEAHATQALHDALTGLPNRTLFRDRTEQALLTSARTGATPAVIFIDLDRFKEVNDTLGHHYGDLLLIEVGRRLATQLRDCDTIARLGGDEFAVLLSHTDRSGGRVAARRVRELLHQPFIVEGVTLDLEASIGVAIAETSFENVETLLRRADIAMHAAKEHKSGFELYDAALDDKTPARLAMLGELRRALETNDLVVYFQPKLDCSTLELRGAEALVRWQHPTRGLIPPGEFIPLAEGTGLITPLTASVLDKALARCRAWMNQGEPIPVAVNVSARSLLDVGFPRTVRTLLERHNVPANLLELEITESTIMTDPTKALEILGQLRDTGIRLSLDDFGTGYSSMSYLKRLPVNELKIDSSFVTDMADDPSNVTLVESAIELGHNLGLSAVAEGVEDEQTRVMLRNLGCDLAQGHYLGRPMEEQEFARWRARRNSLRATT